MNGIHKQDDQLQLRERKSVQTEDEWMTHASGFVALFLVETLLGTV